jgi:hypothetical protein
MIRHIRKLWLEPSALRPDRIKGCPTVPAAPAAAAVSLYLPRRRTLSAGDRSRSTPYVVYEKKQLDQPQPTSLPLQVAMAMPMLPCMPQPYNNITSFFYQFHEEPRQQARQHESESERDTHDTTHCPHRTLDAPQACS